MITSTPRRSFLALDVGSAVNGGNPEAGLFGQRLEHLAHLDR
jgi:hypothetical protein